MKAFRRVLRVFVFFNSPNNAGTPFEELPASAASQEEVDDVIVSEPRFMTMFRTILLQLIKY
jgi:hypothetical protein